MKVHMKALNRAFEKAFEHSSENDNILELIECMGEEMGCERISIFEENEEGTCDNTYEWCRPGVVREQIMLQHVAVAKFDSWHDRLIGREYIVVRNREELKEHDPDVYRMFVDEDIHRAIVTLLAFHGKNFGFCILEDPSGEVMEDEELIMPGVRYILSSMLYSRNLVAKLRRLGYIDSLTGAGNRVSLQEHLEQLDTGKSVSVICIDVIGWDDASDKIPQLEKEQTLLRAGHILTDIFDEEHVFRVASGEFVIVENGADDMLFKTNMRSIRGLFREHNLLAAICGERREALEGPVDDFIHELHKKAEEERKLMLSHRKTVERHGSSDHDGFEKARIGLPRGDEFFRLADQFLAGLFEESVAAIVTDINYFK